MNCCIHLKGESAAAPTSNKRMTPNDFKNCINQVFKDIDDASLPDDYIIEYLQNLNLSKQFRSKIVEIKSGSEEFTLLHSAAKQCRAKLCAALINDYKIDRDILCASKSTPLQILVKSNVISKTPPLLERDAAFMTKKNQLNEAFKVFIEKNSNVNNQDDLGMTALHLAIQKRNFEGAFLLINSPGINVNIHDKKLQTPLHLACKYGPDELISLLIDKTDSVLICSYKPPSSAAALSTSAESVNMQASSVAAIAAGAATPLPPSPGGLVPPALAIVVEKTATSQVTAVNPTSPLHLICKSKEEKLTLVAQALDKLKMESSPQRPLIDFALQREDLTRQTIGHLVIANNHLRILEMLFRNFDLDREVKEGKMGNYLIHTAAKNGSTRILELLETYDAVSFKTNSNRENALHIAAEYNSSLFIREFLDFEYELVNNPESERFMRCMCVCDRTTILRTNSMASAPATAAGTAGPPTSSIDSSGANFSLNITTGYPSTSNQAAATAIGPDNVQIPVHLHQPSVRAKNKDLYTPLMSALAFGNHKCVEELLNAKEIEIETKDIEGNSIYHICARFNNIESLKYLLDKYFDRTSEVLYSRNNQDETVIHVACRNGHLDVIKIILRKLYNTNYLTLLNAKNLAGQTCFHVACMKGYHNIVEYFLRDIKLVSFLETVDNDANSSLHFAAEHGHSSIVKLLLEFGCDVEAKNELNLTPLDLSCRQGFFEISKMLIMRYSKVTDSQTPLHAAAAEGAHEVVKLLLEKGASIDKLDEQNRNCLDIAISRGHREVVRVLLEDKNWDKLIRLNNFDDENVSFNVITGRGELVVHDPNRKQPVDRKLQENPQLVAMYEHKMWDSMHRVLDRCIHTKYYDFSKIDMPLVSMSKHPLMLIAQSGQENLLKHKTTCTLLDLKWRHIPRLMYNFNMLYYIVFLILLSIYSIELAKVGSEFAQEIQENQLRTLSEDYDDMGLLLPPPNQTAAGTVAYNSYYNETRINLSEFEDELAYQTDNKFVFMVLMIFLISSIIKEGFQFLVLEGFSYFSSLQNIAEMLTYTLSIISLVSTNYNIKAAYGSLAILFAFLVFPLYIQKLKVFGVYVVAFLRTLSNSAKFFPVFLIIYVGFMLSFRIRSNYGVSYFESTLYSLIRTFTMVSGELETDKMGLTDSYASLPNYIIYFLFIGLMCTILINLFVGIAVGEIKTVLDEADLQQISMRIMFVLKVQSAITPFKRTFVGKYLNMTWVRYYPDEERSIFKLAEIWFREFTNVFKSKQPEINLVDTQKRLEETLFDMNKQTIDQIKSIKALFNNQVNDVETKLNNSQVRVEDSLHEMSRNTSTYLDQLIEQMTSTSKAYQQRLETNEQRVQTSFEQLSTNILNEFNYSKLYVTERLSGIESKLDALIQQSFKRTNSNLDSMNTSLVDQMRATQRRLGEFEERVGRALSDSSRALSTHVNSIRTETSDVLRAQLGGLVAEFRALQQELANMKRMLTAMSAVGGAESTSGSGGGPSATGSSGSGGGGTTGGASGGTGGRKYY